MTHFFKRWLLTMPCVLVLGACATSPPSMVKTSEASPVVAESKSYPACWSGLDSMVSVDGPAPSYQQPLAVRGKPGQTWSDVLASDPFLAGLVRGHYVSVSADATPGKWWLSTAPKGRNVLGFWNPSHGFCIGVVQVVGIETYSSESSTIQLPVTRIDVAPGIDATDFHGPL